MRLLLDTNALLWSAIDSDQLRPEAREIIRTPKNEVYVSVASLWEIAIKQGIGKLKLEGSVSGWLLPLLERLRFDVLDITPIHVAEVAMLPLIHRDPFDRMLVAQAKALDLMIVTRDRRLKDYGVPIMQA